MCGKNKRMERMNMRRYKVLITGKNNIIIDDIFVQLGDVFDTLCCSYRHIDRLRHLDLFKPDLFIICLNGESMAEMSGFAELKRILTSNGVVTVVIGKDEECEMFEKHAIQVADLILTRPVSMERIRTEILKLMEQYDREKEEQAELFKELSALKQSREKKHVLIVDDDPLMLKVVKEYLGDQYQVATAISGKVAMKFLESKVTNLILLDYEMPVENGKEVLRKIRGNKNLSNVPVVFLTGVTERQKLMEVLTLQPQGYLLKPVDREKLLGTIEKFIG